MVKGTLPIWVIVLVLGTLVSMLAGFFNVYVPKDQKLLVKKERRKIGLKKLGSLGPEYVSSKLRFDRTRYLRMSIGVTSTTMIAFFIEGYFERLCNKIGRVSAWVICIIVYLVGILIVLSLIRIMEEFAFSDIERKYWRRYKTKVKFPKEER